jgi:hypothetical protein
MRSSMARRVSCVVTPSATPRWFETTATKKPADARRATASGASGSHLKSSTSET